MKDVIIYDSQDITRLGIEKLLAQMKQIHSLHIARTKKELIEFLITHPSAVVIMDYSLSDFGSADELLNANARFPEVFWILFSEELSIDFLKRIFLSSESISIVLKMCTLDQIEMSIRQSVDGERFICSRVVNQLLIGQKKQVEKDENLLTITEKEILKEIALGKTTKEIAAVRNLSFHTVITHRKNIFRKLEVNNVHEATKYAVKAGIVDMAEYYI